MKKTKAWRDKLSFIRPQREKLAEPELEAALMVCKTIIAYYLRQGI